VSLVDIFPTLADVMGVKLDSPLDGISLLEPSNSKKRFNRSVYYEVTYGKEAMWGAQTREFKLVLNKKEGSEYFYDLRKDPEQKQNVGHTDTRSLQLMKQLLASYVQKSTSPTEWAKSKQDKQESNELREQLKALGYIN
jgi:arylsulfatase A-like enzyme